jgi:hypothetical protein
VNDLFIQNEEDDKSMCDPRWWLHYMIKVFAVVILSCILVTRHEGALSSRRFYV